MVLRFGSDRGLHARVLIAQPKAEVLQASMASPVAQPLGSSLVTLDVDSTGTVKRKVRRGPCLRDPDRHDALLPTDPARAAHADQLWPGGLACVCCGW